MRTLAESQSGRCRHKTVTSSKNLEATEQRPAVAALTTVAVSQRNSPMQQFALRPPENRPVGRIGRTRAF